MVNGIYHLEHGFVLQFVNCDRSRAKITLGVN